MHAHFYQGTAKAFDHCTLVHVLWKTFAELHVGIWIERIPTKENIADDPSRSHTSLVFVSTSLPSNYSVREDYRILNRLGAIRIEPRLFDVFLQSQTWQQLSIAGTRAVKRRC